MTRGKTTISMKMMADDIRIVAQRFVQRNAAQLSSGAACLVIRFVIRPISSST